MPKEEWGTKRVCPTTGKRFYDLNRNPVISPYTGEVVEIDTGTRSRIAIADKTEDEAEDLVVEDEEDVLEEAEADVDLEDDLLEDDDEDSVPLDEIADVASDDDES
ncbi:MAG: TIGR02300 family protein [Alphaproteobacteria bacterium]|nr:MAG: TIGR02300 family protein [Alphaproteobacteria bacterium]